MDTTNTINYILFLVRCLNVDYIAQIHFQTMIVFVFWVLVVLMTDFISMKIVIVEKIDY
jgi:hypothetical protein